MQKIVANAITNGNVKINAWKYKKFIIQIYGGREMNERNLRINYHVEIINDAKTWDKFLKATGSLNAPHSDAPWELYTSKDFDSFEKALEYYMVWYVSDSCYDIKMWEEIYLDDKMIYEEYCEPDSCTRSEMRRMLDKGTYDRLNNYDRQTKELLRNNELMNGFIKRMGRQFEEMFYQYTKEVD